MEYIYKATKFKHNIDKNINTATDTWTCTGITFLPCGKLRLELLNERGQQEYLQEMEDMKMELSNSDYIEILKNWKNELQELFIELNELDEDEAFEIELEERFAGKN